MERINLNEVSFIRPILIVLLVLYHAFAIYDGVWRAPVGFNNIYAYSWVSKASYSIMLEMFVFISGYLWAFQHESLGGVNSFIKTTKNKFFRLLLPCFVFSLLYLILFNRNNELNISVLDALSGVAHLWFLPMLFWCFIFGFWIVRLNISPGIKLLALFVLASLSVLPIPFRIPNTLQYLFFFVSGYYTYLYKDRIISILASKQVLLWIGFIVSFILLTMLQECLYKFLIIDRSGLLFKVIYLESKIYSRIVFASLGVFALYISSVSFTRKHSLSKWYIAMGDYCMGIYIFQQFILQYIIYYTQLPTSIGFVVFPWIAFILALLASILMSYTVKSL